MIKLGDVYRIKMYKSDGIRPKGTDTFRYKYIIIVGYDGNSFYGAVATNTRDHHIVPIEYQYPLNHQGYNCFVNCYKLHEVSSVRLTSDCYEGEISDDDFELIVGCVRNSPIIPAKVLKKYGVFV